MKNKLYIILILSIFFNTNHVISKTIYDHQLSEQVYGNVKEYRVYFIRHNSNIKKIKIKNKRQVYLKRYNKQKELIEKISWNGKNKTNEYNGYDKFSNIISYRSYKNKRLIVEKLWKYAYNKNGDIINKHEYDTENRLVSVCFNYSDKINKIKTCMNKNTKGEISNVMISRLDKKNDGSYVTKDISYTPDGDLLYKRIDEYDDRDNLIKSILFNKKDKIEKVYSYKLVYKKNMVIKKIEHVNKKKKIITGYDYDKKGKLLKEWFYLYGDKNNKVITHYLYDNNGNWNYLINNNGAGYYREIIYYKK